MTKTEQEILFVLNEPLPLVSRPFLALSRRLGITEKDLLEQAQNLKRRNVIRRVGVQLSHRKAGLACNVLVAWKVPRARTELVGRTFAAFDEVTHCYLRRSYPKWRYNLYTMVHGRDRASCLRTVRRMARAAGVKEYQMLFTVREFKKIKSDIQAILS